MDNLTDSEILKREVKRDMGQDYINKLSNILSEIDLIRNELVSNYSMLPYLNERLHSLFLKLTGKMTTDEIKNQYDLHNKIIMIKVFTQNMRKHGKNTLNVNWINFNKYKVLCEQREIDLNKILEKNGLTNIQEPKRKKVH